MFLTPPNTTAAVLHPNQKERETVEISFPNSGQEIIHANTIGELGLRLWLEPFTGMDESGLLAEQWRGDRYQLRRRKDKQFTFTWKIALADEKSAKILKTEVERSMIPHFHETQASRKTEVTVSDTILTFTNSPKK